MLCRFEAKFQTSKTGTICVGGHGYPRLKFLRSVLRPFEKDLAQAGERCKAEEDDVHPRGSIHRLVGANRYTNTPIARGNTEPFTDTSTVDQNTEKVCTPYQQGFRNSGVGIAGGREKSPSEKDTYQH